MIAHTLDERVSRACCQLALILAAVNAQDPTVLDVPPADVAESVFAAALDALNALGPLRQAPPEVLAWQPAATGSRAGSSVRVAVRVFRRGGGQ